MEPDIQRINGYEDNRFSQKILRQHGAFLVDGEPYEVEIIGSNSAVIRGASPQLYSSVIELFRFYAGHISQFYDAFGNLVCRFPPVELFSVKLDAIQPSQFYVDEEKLAAVRSFISSAEDIVIPVTRDGERLISQDGHTRLAVAVERKFDKVNAFIEAANDSIYGFVAEARKRGVITPYDLTIIPHEEYEVKWNQFCDDFFQRVESEST